MGQQAKLGKDKTKTANKTYFAPSGCETFIEEHANSNFPGFCSEKIQNTHINSKLMFQGQDTEK